MPDGLRLAWSRARECDVLRIEGATRELPVFSSDLLDDRGGARVPPVLSNRLDPMPGTYERDDAGVTFTPRFPFLRGRSYSVVVDDDSCLTIELPAPTGDATTSVTAIHPTGPVVPRNLLRCYVTFSGPMSEGQVPARVRVLDAVDGNEVEDALLAMDPELWDPERRRLTVLFDPARIKRGLVPHREAGYPLREGTAVELVIDGEMRDAGGRPLVAEARRRYDVGPDVRSRVDPTHWLVDRVGVGTRSPLIVTFDRTLDRALLDHCVTVVRPDGSAVRGHTAPSRDDDRWSFAPDAPWAAVEHLLVVDSILEDVCGNSAARVFDRDLADPDHVPASREPVVVRFTPH